MATKKTTKKTVSKQAVRRLSRAEEAMTGGEVPPAWPCGEKCSAQTCTHKGRRLLGTVETYDKEGGKNKRGFLDVKPLDGGATTRFWLNQNAQTVLRTSLKKSGLLEDEVEGAEIAAEFLDWVRTGSGYFTRTFLIGLASTEQMEPGERDEGDEQ